MRHNQNRRSRGRNNNNRKGPNPLTRSFESNGPDVKVRGTAVHIAEKYLTLARDAQAAGDIVAVESYLQHAEHYNRIVMAAQAQFREQQPQFREGGEEGYDERQGNGRGRDRFEFNGESSGGADDDVEARGEGGEEDGGERGYRQQQDRPQQDRQQPDRQDRQDRPRGPRPDRYQFRDRPDRQERDDRGDRLEGQDRQERDNRGDRPERQDRQERPERNDRFEEREPRPEPVAAAESVDAENQPRRRRGRPRNENGGETGGDANDPEATPDGAAALAAFRSES